MWTRALQSLEIAVGSIEAQVAHRRRSSRGRPRAPRVLCVAAFALAVGAFVADAREPNGPTPQTPASRKSAAATRAEAQAELARVEAARDAAQKRLKALETSGVAASRELNAIDADLLSAASDSQRREEAALAAEQRLATLRLQADAARRDLAHDRATGEDLLAALMTMGSRRPPALAASPDDAGAAVRAAILMSEAAPALSARARTLAQTLDALRAAEDAIRAESETLSHEETALAARRQEIEALAGEKRRKRLTLAAETARLHAESDELARRAETLRDLLDNLSNRKAPASSPPPAAVSAVTTPRPASAPPRAEDATPRSAVSHAVPPAIGRITQRFSQGKSNDRPGLVYVTRPGAQVVAPMDARVEFAGLFRSYGEMLILDVGGDYLVVVSGLDGVYADLGQWVLAGEPIGRMSARKTPAPELYLEVRRGGTPIDPERWLHGGR